VAGCRIQNISSSALPLQSQHNRRFVQEIVVAWQTQKLWTIPFQLETVGKEITDVGGPTTLATYSHVLRKIATR
jgi:hypothetical protein